MNAACTLAGAAVAVVLLSSAAPARAQDEWQQAYRIGDRVELHISGSHWQRCAVTENSPGSVMRGLCDEYVEPAPGTYRRAGGTYILYKGDVRPYQKPFPPRASTSSLTSRSGVGVTPASGQSFAVGERVEIEASNHWLPCVVVENDPPTIMRVRCDAYSPLSRDAGIYTVDRDNPTAVRKAGTGAASRGAPPTVRPAPRPDVAGEAGLKLGEYACYGSGGRILAGLGFKVLAGNRYADLDGASAGSYSISGATISFRGGHMDGQVGRELRNHNFRIGTQASCEPF